MTIRATKNYAGNLEKRFQDAHAAINNRGPRHIRRHSGWRLVRDESPEPLLVEGHVMYLDYGILCHATGRDGYGLNPETRATYAGMTFRNERTGEEVTV